MIREVFALLFLGASGISDAKQKSVPLYLPVCGLLLAIGISMYSSDVKITEAMLSLIPGVAFLIISFASSGKIGTGDGLTMIALGLLCGIWDTVTTMIYASFASGFVALFLLITKKKNKNYSMPYLPFLLCGYFLTLLIKRTY